MGALSGEEKWRLDRTGTPEGWLRRGRGSHAWRDPQGLRSGWSAPSISPAQLAGEVCQALGPGPTPSEAPSGPHWSWGHRKEAEGRTGEAGRRGPPGPEEQEGVEGVGPTHSSPGSLLSSQVQSPTL